MNMIRIGRALVKAPVQSPAPQPFVFPKAASPSDFRDPAPDDGTLLYMSVQETGLIQSLLEGARRDAAAADMGLIDGLLEHLAIEARVRAFAGGA